MLVLSRTVGETVVVGDNVRVTVKEIRGNRVHLAVEAPREVKVRRSEQEVRDRVR